MTTNSLLVNPIKIIIYDPVTEQSRRTFVFLGDVPKNVSTACIDYGARAEHDRILKNYYGDDFRTKLAISPTRRGGDELDDIADMLAETTRAVETTERTVIKPGVEYVTSVHLFPEDKFSEVKEKIYVVTDIPAYRQHLFYIHHGRAQTTYKIYADGFYDVDARRIQSRDNIYGIPIDKTLSGLREQIRVEALDTFKILGEHPIDTIYIIDIAQFTTRVHSQLVDLVNDTYQFELLYYGFVMKYWPQLTAECFHDYITGESQLQYKYPDLAKNKTSLAAIYRVERDIINNNYKNIIRAMGPECPAPIAITQMIASVNGRTLINIRNLFDRLRVTRIIPEVHAYIDVGGRKYLLRKRHIRNGTDIQFPSGNLMKAGLTIAISLRAADQKSFHAKISQSTIFNEQSRYLFLNIWPNGKYHIKTIWNEEDEIGFENIIKIIKKFTDPIITGINGFGRYVFAANGELPLVTRQNIIYQSLNICTYWKKVMLENTFKLVKTLWEPYMRAQITGHRNVQQFDKYEFVFRKGMHEFDNSAIERIITASNNIILNNHYAHLSNSSIKQKWDQNYEGRIVRMTHRTTDVRFEVLDIRENEFKIFYMYIVMFIYGAAADERVQESISSAKSYKDVKRLRKLREQDPELYNLKKHGSKKVYSSICQNKRQPLIYTDDEIKAMPAAERKKLTEYWNFTLGKPAYYGCPDKRYPHLNFMVSVHPRDYCLPCCNKKPQEGGDSRKTRINAICLQKHKYIDERLSMSISRHIMNYGKDIDIGRLSKVPQSAVKNLFFSTLDDPKLDYYLFGVGQHVPGLPHIGILYAAAESMGAPMTDVVKRIVRELRAMAPMLFSTLLGGMISEYFRSADDLIATLKELFLDMNMLTRDVRGFKQWPELLTELFHAMGINIITLIDESGAGDVVDLFIPDILKNEMSLDLHRGVMSNILISKSYVIIIKRRNNYYPIFAINTDIYFKTLEVQMRTYKYDSKIIQLIFHMTQQGLTDRNARIDKPIDLGFIKDICGDGNARSNTTYIIRKKFINKHNLCYALIIGTPEGDVYCPIDYSVYAADGIDIDFGAFRRTDYTLKWSALRSFVDAINSIIEGEYSSGGINAYRPVRFDNYVSVGGAIIGAQSRDYIYYFTESPDGDLPIVDMKYDYNEINNLIISRAPPMADNRIKNIGASLYNNYLYQLFIVEFVNYLDSERNDSLRGIIIDLIRKTNFGKDINPFNQELKKLLSENDTDYNIMQGQLNTFYYEHFNKQTLIDQINTTTYDFDRVTVNRLKKMGRPELVSELRRIADIFSVQREFDVAQINFPNVYIPCDNMTINPGYCAKNKLMINGSIDELVDILATDLTNDLKSHYLLSGLYLDNIISMFDFVRWPSEVITVYSLND